MLIGVRPVTVTAEVATKSASWKSGALPLAVAQGIISREVNSPMVRAKMSRAARAGDDPESRPNHLVKLR